MLKNNVEVEKLRFEIFLVYFVNYSVLLMDFILKFMCGKDLHNWVKKRL